MSVTPEFPPSEYEDRWRRARAAMAGAGLDALLVTSEANYRYLSGHHTGFWLSKSRPTYQLEEIYVVTASGAELLTAPSAPELRVVP